MVGPTLQILLDGDCNKAYHRGEKISGRVVLVIDNNKQKIDSLKVEFLGTCATRTSRPFHVNSSSDAAQARRNYEEKIHLFHREQELVVASSDLSPGKYTRPFEFTFPELTEQRCKRPGQGTRYLREPHSLPPSFQLTTNAPGGAAQISYFVQARLALQGSSKCIQSPKEIVRYQPSLDGVPLPEAKATSAVLSSQTWKPSVEKADSRTALNKVLPRRLKNNGGGPRIVPCLARPNRVVPGQHMPLSLTLVNTREPIDETLGDCILDSLYVTISTFSTVVSGHKVTYPEDIVSKHVKCIAKTNMGRPLPFGQAKALTRNFRLIDDGECVPSFRTYNITRRYELNVAIGIKYNDQCFTIKSKSPLDILPPSAGALLFPAAPTVEQEIDPLPLYVPRDPEEEAAPAYESLFALEETSSRGTSSRGSESGSESPVSGASMTPESEDERGSLEGLRLGSG